MILIIDNYDSFTYNLVQYLGELGAEMEVHRNDQITLDEIERLAPERIVISPGPKTPSEAGICLDVIRDFSGRTPILGVCLGHQAIGQAFGGKVIRAPRIDARQDQRDFSRRQDDFFRPAQSFSGHPVSLTDRRTQEPSRMSRRFRHFARRADHGLPPQKDESGRRPVPSRIRPHRFRQTAPGKFS